jgi:hypothetical protein
MEWKNAVDDAPAVLVPSQPANLLFHLPAVSFCAAMSGNFLILLMLPFFPFWKKNF